MCSVQEWNAKSESQKVFTTKDEENSHLKSIEMLYLQIQIFLLYLTVDFLNLLFYNNYILNLFVVEEM